MGHMFNVWVSRIVVLGMHAACFLVIWSGVSWAAAVACLLGYLVRGFAITGGYHRYFAHPSYRTSPLGRAILGALGCTAVQGGPIEWARNHRHHHQQSDKPEDLHSPKWPSFLWAHLGWMLSSKEQKVSAKVSDLERCPDLVWIERLQIVFILAYVGALYAIGAALGDAYGTSGFQFVVWGFVISTVFTWHVTWCINSVNHTWGSRRFETSDDSRNNWLTGLLALGEGHHNNHHAHPSLVRQGLFWWEIDLTYYTIKILSWVGLVWDLKEPEPELYTAARALGKVRSSLARRRFDKEAMIERLRACQSSLKRAVAVMSSLRESTKMLFQAGKIKRDEMLAKLREGRDAFLRAVATAEAAACA